MEGVDGKHHSDGLFLSGGRQRRAMLDLVGESCRKQIDTWVRTAGGKEGYWQGLGSGDALTSVNRTRARSGSGRPESGKKALPRPSDELGKALGIGGGVLDRLGARGLYL